MDDDEAEYSMYELIIGAIKNGDRKSMFPPRGPDTANKYAEVTKDLKYITRHVEECRGIKVENLVGFTQVPLGLAGPLQINGSHQKGSFFAPLATIEAALVASVSRGCKAFQRCGGVKVCALSEGMGRAPVFVFGSVDDALAFYKQVPELKDQLRRDAEATSKYVRLLRITPHILGMNVHVHFEYARGDAAGQNMVTIATHKACSALVASFLGKELHIVDQYSEGHMCADKQITAAGGIRNPRGVQVLAWGVLSDETCREAQYNDETRDLSLSLYFPSLPVGLVGGGTAYSTQREALELVGCTGPGKKWALAETVAAFALALDISTGASIASDQHASGHQRLARASKL